MTETADDGEDLAEEALGSSPRPRDVSDVMLERQFQPWHKPRKHYVRIKQWCSHAEALIADLKKSRGATKASLLRPISYLSLPGDDLLDVRTLYGVCERQDVSLRFLGYNTTDSGRRRLNSEISQSELTMLERIDKSSCVLEDSIQNVALPKSVARFHASQHAPYDIINLDLCDSVIRGANAAGASTLNAIVALLEHQRSRTSEPWLLFITTRVDHGSFEADAWEDLKRLIKRNRDTNDNFQQALEALGARSDDIDLEDWTSTQDNQCRAFTIGIGKWLLSLLVSAEPRWKVSLLSVFTYQVSSPKDMCSISFRFDKVYQRMTDISGLTGPVLGPIDAHCDEDSEGALATRIAEQASACTDIDALFSGDPDLYERYVTKCAKILEAARYDPDLYREWAKAE